MSALGLALCWALGTSKYVKLGLDVPGSQGKTDTPQG